LSIVTAFVVLLVGCHRDPNVTKHRYLESGDTYYAKARYREAAIQYQNAIKIDPKYAEAHYQLAECYLRLSNWAGAYQELLRVIDQKPDDPKAQIALGSLLLAAHKFPEAQERAEQLLKKDPNSVDARVLLANAYAGQQDIQASLQEMQGAIDLAPGKPETYLNMAVLQLSAKKTEQAEQSFRKAVELDPKSLTAALALGNFCASQRRWAEAEQQFRHAVELEPKNPLPRIALARLYPHPRAEISGRAGVRGGQEGLGRQTRRVPPARGLLLHYRGPCEGHGGIRIPLPRAP
jgi:tetratricopeptide (TPR) repeat protein